MQKIIEQLQALGFSRIEAQVYCDLVVHGKSNGSQLAKKINIARSSVYSALDQLYARGIVEQTPGETREFIARNPAELFPALGRRLQETAGHIGESLAALHRPPEESLFINMSSPEAMEERIGDIIRNSQNELYINCAGSFSRFYPELRDAAHRGVGIWIFTFDSLPEADFPCRIYDRPLPDPCIVRRVMLVADMKRGLLASGPRGGELSGTYSENPLFVSVLAEHIHHDIYLYRLREQYQTDVVTPGILLGSRLERREKGENCYEQ